MHVDCRQSLGAGGGYYSGNLLAPAGRAHKLVPLAMSDPTGRWENSGQKRGPADRAGENIRV